MANNNSEDFYNGVLQGRAFVRVGDVLHDPIPLSDGKSFAFLRREVQRQQKPRDAYHAIPAHIP
ncbi:hypothetical protein SAMN06295879_3435 [Agreia bicolorata]|uniref:Uncharacterized protein n=1 Tax=Agreia bicolorata TaxID=110935 RepID=A0A1T4YJZ4_9MICO|nr:hypothetical protein SAMN06295879_3435 [Agreia bicolorata]